VKELQLSLFQALVLLQFNGPTGLTGLTFRQLIDTVGIGACARSDSRMIHQFTRPLQMRRS
jgi:hypothetical protein